MKFSVFSLMQWPGGQGQSHVFGNELEQLAAAEPQGYYGAWIAEHQVSRSGIGPAIPLSAANLAARTSTIRIGTAITILPFMHPLRTAEEAAMLDILSEGRVDWGVGRGYQGHEFKGVEVDIATSHEIFFEQLEIIKKAWSGESFSHSGQFYNFSELQCFPSPIQRPGPTVYLSGSSAPTIEWAATHGYSVLADPLVSFDRLGASRKLYLEAAAKAATAPASIAAPAVEHPILRHVYVSESMSRAREEAGPALLRYYRALIGSDAPSARLHGSDSADEGFDEIASTLNQDPEAFVESLLEERAIVGDAAYCIERIAELKETADLAHLIAWQNFGGLSHEQSLASQKRLIEDVAPTFV
ncbi:MAG: alkanesulfonate monooxygenase SsuD [Myxococcota bacterium]|jgi:alkanesulfonate monooxygenase SsuD/methylene tetrahydromethanopterin reductase-like flavin-dependent oxidoreductase (luciferase family)